MKRLIALFLCAMILFSAVSCGAEPKKRLPKTNKRSPPKTKIPAQTKTAPLKFPFKSLPARDLSSIPEI